ncbi:TDP-4-keto-6-deoxy-D-glucose transaminase [Methanospirillum hungatei JF-1]|uniref:TDP-4-keto-6-deoxy-D-glucose transaminase n=1 Tax=Methanospirillum hungatei JF-1 (strain ATCC 27890 / DSM 864 / NBRC 100397 / JF-1) TaxID=323259 RepID=Q2FNG2_METHJ|nr:dTDP-4-amino-4,6-dideoxygalactose transaminase [Methanospirillum hungatei]ABD42795.1 TDP-4-keto-6-deoxy-D-glucose transaminase [Methanospirillum hungatei JF-1]
MKIPFTRPYRTGNEQKYINDILTNIQNGAPISGDGPYGKKCEQLMEEKFGARKVLLTTSCTSALEMATRLINIQPGDEVIMPSFTFVSTANPVVMAGGRPVFVDIDPVTLNIDPAKIEEAITPRTKAIYPVHYAGVSCPMDEIMAIAKKYNVWVVEDAAQGVGAKYKGKYLGTIGDFGCYSFHETKNITCGEGGALVINRDDPDLIERAEIIREKGTDRSKFHRGQVDKYTWVDVGSSYVQSEILAAFLFAQLEAMDEINQKRMEIWYKYYTQLKPFEESGVIRLPVIPDYAEHNAHIFYVLFQEQSVRDTVMKQLQEAGIHAVFHYIPLHSSPMGQTFGCQDGDLPVTEETSGRLLRLPLFTGMSNDEENFILSRLKQVVEELRRNN